MQLGRPTRPNRGSVQPEDTLIIHSLISLHTLIVIDIHACMQAHLDIHVWSMYTDKTIKALVPSYMQCQRQQKLVLSEPVVFKPLLFSVHVIMMMMTKRMKVQVRV